MQNVAKMGTGTTIKTDGLNRETLRKLMKALHGVHMDARTVARAEWSLREKKRLASIVRAMDEADGTAAKQREAWDRYAEQSRATIARISTPAALRAQGYLV